MCWKGPSTGPAHRYEEVLGKNDHFALSPSPSPMLLKSKMDLFTWVIMLALTSMTRGYLRSRSNSGES